MAQVEQRRCCCSARFALLQRALSPSDPRKLSRQESAAEEAVEDDFEGIEKLQQLGINIGVTRKLLRQVIG